MTMKRALLFVVLLAAAPFACAGSIPYKNFYAPLAKATAADPEHQLRVRLKIKPKDPSVDLAKVELKLVAGTSETPLPLDAHGLFELPLRQELADADAQIVSNQPKGTLSITSDIAIEPPRGTTPSYAGLMRAVPAVNRLVKEFAGLMSLFAPTCHGVTLVFGGTTPQQARYRRADGTEAVLTSKPDARGMVIDLERDEKLVAANPTLTLSAEPIGVDPLM